MSCDISASPEDVTIVGTLQPRFAPHSDGSYLLREHLKHCPACSTGSQHWCWLHSGWGQLLCSASNTPSPLPDTTGDIGKHSQVLTTSAFP